jgi:hypothetical protein
MHLLCLYLLYLFLLCVHLVYLYSLYLSYRACNYCTCIHCTYLIVRAIIVLVFIVPALLCVHLVYLYSMFLLIGRVLNIPALTLLLLVVLLNVRVFIVLYRGVKSLARLGRKQTYVSVRMARISFGALPCRKKKLDISRHVPMLLKSRASLTCFRAFFLPGRAKDLSSPRYLYLHLYLLLYIITF